MFQALLSITFPCQMLLLAVLLLLSLPRQTLLLQTPPLGLIRHTFSFQTPDPFSLIEPPFMRAFPTIVFIIGRVVETILIGIIAWTGVIPCSRYAASGAQRKHYNQPQPERLAKDCCVRPCFYETVFFIVNCVHDFSFYPVLRG
ncbi:MAG: hypothetical protein FWD67_12210 [Betaproteobacteria bacterium]|nr:hypothetical protein [Betaproteobacteria bacterium]